MDDIALTQTILDWSTVLVRDSMHDFNRYARAAGLSLTQLYLLLHLYYRGPSEVMNFTELMQVSPAGASQMIERMVQQGLLQRVESPDDRRVRLVNLTSEGRKIVEESTTARRKSIDGLVTSLSQEEKVTIEKVLAMLKQKLEPLEIAENKV
jgi:DNA-binding MarR family transcriptional regulator